jgi:hypothetical protein
MDSDDIYSPDERRASYAEKSAQSFAARASDYRRFAEETERDRQKQSECLAAIKELHLHGQNTNSDFWTQRWRPAQVEVERCPADVSSRLDDTHRALANCVLMLQAQEFLTRSQRAYLNQVVAKFNLDP